VLTERECRQREAAEPADRFSVDVAGARRWPDVVVDAVDGRRAFEIEFASKGTARLRQIVGAYERSRYGEVRFLVRDAALGRRIASLVRGPSELQRDDRARSLPGDRAALDTAWQGASDGSATESRGGV